MRRARRPVSFHGHRRRPEAPGALADHASDRRSKGMGVEPWMHEVKNLGEIENKVENGVDHLFFTMLRDSWPRRVGQSENLTRGRFKMKAPFIFGRQFRSVVPIVGTFTDITKLSDRFSHSWPCSSAQYERGPFA